MNLVKGSQNISKERTSEVDEMPQNGNRVIDKSGLDDRIPFTTEPSDELKNEEFVDGLEWKDGIGTLPGCDDLKFRKNKFGVVELITDDQVVDMNGTNYDDVRDTTLQDGSQLPDISRKQTLGSDMLNLSTDSKKSEDGSNIEIVSVRSEATMMKCSVCGQTGTHKTFYGRFCSRKCVAKNANSYRASNQHLQAAMKQPSKSIPTSGASVVHSNNNNENDLKIRIRLSSSSPPTENHSSYNKKKQIEATIQTQGMTERRKNSFIWSEYIMENGSVMAPASAFQSLTKKNPFPGTNQFKLGMALEGIDPIHQTLICPLTVTAVKGFRLRLHFCGYSESYDFWVNADSTLIFPCGFCEQTGRKLEPPKGHLSENFVWEKYLKKFRLYAAPDVIFSVISEEKDCSFKPEEKLEAVDKHNPDLVCVATVSDVIGENILIHFDGWTHDFDYWCTASSCLIHPVGWCEKEEKVLTPPEGYLHGNFSWKKYIEECGASAANAGSFHKREKHGLRTGMKLEVVDPRNPILIRVATIIDMSEFRIKIHFDGWNDVYDFWTDLDSPDIHPAGWCAKTSYPLQPPLTERDFKKVPGQGGCPIQGCIGVGHIRGSKFAGHHSEFGCPYSQQNLHKQLLHDRLTRSRLSTNTREDIPRNKSGSDVEATNNDDIRPAKIRRTRKSLISEREATPTKPETTTLVSSRELDNLIDDQGKSHFSTTNHSVFISALSSFPNYDLPLCWDQQSKILPGVKGLTVNEMSKWSISEVVKFITDLTGRSEYGNIFKAEEIDGEAMLLLTQTDIAKVLNIKLGPAVKIYNAILLVKAAEHLPV
ncbi:lethal(3)malignant brain tumor-like protein 4 [Styela clava]